MAGARRSRLSRTIIHHSLNHFRAPATGVGGILRDVFTMGAAHRFDEHLRFGSLDHPSTAGVIVSLLAGVVAGSRIRQRFWSAYGWR